MTLALVVAEICLTMVDLIVLGYIEFVERIITTGYVNYKLSTYYTYISNFHGALWVSLRIQVRRARRNLFFGGFRFGTCFGLGLFAWLTCKKFLVLFASATASGFLLQQQQQRQNLKCSERDRERNRVRGRAEKCANKE